MEELLKQILARLDRIDGNGQATATEVVRIGREVDRLGQRVQAVEGRIDIVDIKMDRLAQKVDNMSTDFFTERTRTAERLDRIEKRAAKKKKR